MLWQIEGASEESGEEVSLTIEAPSRPAAEAEARRRGVMVAAVTLRERSLTEEVAAAQQARGAIAYQTPGPPAPKYWGLRIAASLLSVVALLYYIAGGYLIVSMSLAMMRGLPQMRSVESFMFSAMGGAMLLIAGGGLMHGLSAGCLALRDIAINSFSRR